MEGKSPTLKEFNKFAINGKLRLSRILQWKLFGKRRIEEIKSLEEWGWKISIFYVKYKIQNANFDHKNFNPWKCGFYFDL